MIEYLKAPWPWYVSGPLIGLMVPALLFFTNKKFGVSSSFRHVCAACFPGRIPYFNYEWKREAWNLFFVAGIMLGGFIAATLLADPHPVRISNALAAELSGYGIEPTNALLPEQLFNWQQLGTLKGILMIVVGGFMVGFGTRYAGGCTSGHSIMGIANLQMSSIVATIFFMAGGFVMANLILPFILKL